jgi:hypothetical protein
MRPCVRVCIKCVVFVFVHHRSWPAGSVGCIVFVCIECLCLCIIARRLCAVHRFRRSFMAAGPRAPGPGAAVPSSPLRPSDGL